ncbi:F0F1 ATP synthase subunit alpha [Candidatus Acetothermia bacterium]|nr:F0F1 ATP synthase subunit alpha [Candidatus Acetothermia bacterium]
MPRTSAAEISALIKERIKNYQKELKLEETGVVVEVGDGIAQIYGLENCLAAELLEFPHDITGLALNLAEDSVGAVIFGEDEQIKEGDTVKRTGRVLETRVGEELLGRVVSPLGEPKDGRGPIKTTKIRPVEFKAPGIIKRQPVDTPVQTGLKAIDAMTPIGRGQRELIIGDRQTGKTAIAIDTIINQKFTHTPEAAKLGYRPLYCIYVAIGQKSSTVAKTVETLRKYGAMDYTIVVSADASEPAPLQWLAPYAGCAMGEYFMFAGKDALVIYDDLSKHAIAYRELALLLRRPPGREAYPGDIFYSHSRLLERAARMNKDNGGGSLTALPVIETKAGDVTAYIPTNVISITDGQIFLESGLFNAGIRPAMNAGISVSRVGGAAQIKAMSRVAGRLKLDIAQYNDLKAFAEFSSELDEVSRAQLERGKRVQEILKQPQFEPMPVEEQVVVIFAATNGFVDDLAVERLHDFERGYLDFMRSRKANILATLREKKVMDKETDESLRAAIKEFKEMFA